MTDQTEPAITINVALETFAMDLRDHGLGDDEHGTTMTHGYLAAIRVIRELMRGEG
jgi:hypothetical protein